MYTFQLLNLKFQNANKQLLLGVSKEHLLKFGRKRIKIVGVALKVSLARGSHVNENERKAFQFRNPNQKYQDIFPITWINFAEISGKCELKTLCGAGLGSITL